MKRLRLAGVPEHFNYPWELADQAGLYRDLGVNVQFIEEPGGTGAMCQALARGDVDAALLLTEGAVLDVLRGSGNRLLKVYVSTPLVWGIHVPAGSDIREVAQIERRTVAISREGSGSHLIAIVDGDDMLLFGTAAGSPRHPSWYYNLRANPEIDVEYGSERFAARVVQLPEAEARARVEVQASGPEQFAGYLESAAPRVIPVFSIQRL